jgi:hypothetical protein
MKCSKTLRFLSSWTVISLATLALVFDGLNPSLRVVLWPLCHFPTTAGNYHLERSFRALGQYQSCCLMMMSMICWTLIRPHPSLDLEWLMILELKEPERVRLAVGSSRIVARGLALWSLAPSVDLLGNEPKDPVERIALASRLISSMDTLPLLDRPTTKTRVTSEEAISSTSNPFSLLPTAQTAPALPLDPALSAKRALRRFIRAGLVAVARAVLLRRLSTPPR